MTTPPRPLVDRDDQRAELWRHDLAVPGNGPAAVLVTGAGGIGKTSLVEELAARHEGPVLRATAAEWESGCPHGVLAQLLGHDPATLAPGDALAAASLLADRVARDVPSLAIVDDVHWADPESLRALSGAVRHHRDLPLLAVLAGRLDRAPSVTADLLRRCAGRTIHLGPLGAQAVGELAAEHGRPLPPWVAQRLTRHTEGTPRHVLALLDELPADVWSTPDPRLPPPAEVAVAVRERLAELGPDARALVDAAAAMAKPASLDELCRVAGLDEVLAPLEEAAQHGLLRRFGGRSIPVVGPADPMVRAAVLDVAGPRAAARLRLRAADVVAEPARRLAYRAAATPGPDPELAEQLVALARDKAAEGAWSAVADAYMEAGRLTPEHDPREQRLIRAVDAMIGAGEVLEAGAVIPIVEDLRNTPLRNAVLGYLAILLGRATEAQSRLARAWELVDPDRDPDTAAWVCQRHVLDALVRCRGEELVAWADRTASLVGPDAPAAVEAAAIRGLGTAAAGRPDEAVTEYRAATERIRQGAQTQRVVMGQGWLDLVVDEYDEARAALESAVPTTTLGGSSRISLWALGWLSRVQFVTGDWDLALRSTGHGLRLAEQTGIVIVTPLLAWTATQVHSLRGDRERAQRSVRAAEAGARDYEMMSAPRHLARAHVAEVRADYPAVLRALRPLTRAPEASCVAEPGWWPWTDVYANALVLEGDLDEAGTFLDVHQRRASERGHRSSIARLGWARGRLHGARGDLDRARQAFDASLELLDDLPLRWDRARANFAYGQTLRRAGKRRDADAVLTIARDLFLALGASSYVERCDRELRAGGVHTSRSERGLHELTAQETAVADLVARGLPNKEIAGELHVSPKTVQYHLTRIFNKLGVRSRSELAVLHGHGPSN